MLSQSELLKVLRRYSEPYIAYKLDGEFAAAVTQVADALDPGVLNPCPFCGGEARIAVCDEEGNIHDDSYRNDTYSGLTFAIIHDDSNAGTNCPIAMFEGDGTIGRYGYATEEEAIKAWNTRVWS